MIHGERTLLQRFQALDMAGMMGITGAGIYRKVQRMGNGANLAFPKALFEAVDGYRGNEERASGDDLFLLQKIARTWPDGIFFLKNPQATVLTGAAPDLRAFVRQRLRWGTKNAALPETAVRLVLAVVWVLCLSIPVNLILALWFPPLAVLAMAQLAVKAAADYSLLNETCCFFNRSDLLRGFWPSFFLHTAYMAIVGTASLAVRRYTWKGRVVS